MKKLVLFTLIIMFLSGCSQLSVNTINPTQTAQTNTPTFLVVTDTPVLPPTVTPKPSPTATLSFPLLAGTALPSVKTPITAKNISSLRETLDWWDQPATISVLSPDKSLKAVSSSEWVKVIDQSTKKEISQFSTNMPINGFSADNSYLFSGGTLLDLEGNVVFQVESAGPVSYSDDYKRVAVVKSCLDTGLVFPACETDVYNVGDENMINGFPGYNPKLSPDGTYVALEQQNYITFRNVDNGKITLELNPDNYLMDYPVWFFSPDGTKIVLVHSDLQGAQQASVNILSLIDGKMLKAIYAPIIRNAWLSKNGNYLAATNDSEVNIYDVNSKEILTTIPINEVSEINGVDDFGKLTFGPTTADEAQRESFILDADPITRLNFGENSRNLNFIRKNQYCSMQISGLTTCESIDGFLANDGNYYTAEADAHKVVLNKIVNGKPQEISRMDWKYPAFENITGTKLVGYSVGRDYLVLSLRVENISNQVITVNMKTQKIQNKWDCDSSGISYAKMSPDGKFEALHIMGVRGDKHFFVEGIFDFESGWMVWSGGNADTYLMDISPDSTKLVEVQNRNGVSLLYYYDFISKELIDYHEMTNCDVTATALNHDSSLLLIGCGNTIQVMDLAKKKTIYSWQAFNSPISSIAFSDDGTRIAAGTRGGFIKVWDLGE